MAISRIELSKKDKDILSIYQKDAQTNKKETGRNEDQVGSFIEALNDVFERERSEGRNWKVERLEKKNKSLFKITGENDKSFIIYITLNPYIVPNTWKKFCQYCLREKDMPEENKLCVWVHFLDKTKSKFELYCIPQSKLEEMVDFLFEHDKSPLLYKVKTQGRLLYNFAVDNKDYLIDDSGNKPSNDPYITASKIFFNKVIKRWEKE